MDDPELSQLSEYIASEAGRDELVEKSSAGRGQVTLVVFREGEQLNFFRVVDRGDGNFSPLSESMSGGSPYNLCDEDEEEVEAKDRVVENDKTKEKMKLLKSKMETLTISKKPKAKKHMPRPPSSGRPGSKVRLRRLPSSGSAKSRPITLNKNPCLPPVGQSRVELSPVGAGPSRLQYTPVGPSHLEHTPLVPSRLPIDMKLDISDCDLSPVISSGDVSDIAVLSEAVTETSKSDLVLPNDGKIQLGSIMSNSDEEKTKELNLLKEKTEKVKEASFHKDQPLDAKDSNSAKQDHVVKDKDFVSDYKETSTRPHKKKDLSLATLRESLAQPKVPKKKDDTPRQSTSNKKEVTFDAIHETLGHPATPDRMREFTLESLSQREARAVSGMLRQASIERLGSSRLNTFLRSASKSRAGFTVNSSNINSGRISTPEGRMVSARLSKLSSGQEDRITSPTHRLPPVRTKKKSKKCFICNKKTGLATSYPCRCGNNFCATHRYAEAHSCTFDYKTEGRKLLEQSNPVVTAPKLPKI